MTTVILPQEQNAPERPDGDSGAGAQASGIYNQLNSPLLRNDITTKQFKTAPPASPRTRMTFTGKNDILKISVV